jgi:hypothetical protein
MGSFPRFHRVCSYSLALGCLAWTGAAPATAAAVAGEDTSTLAATPWAATLPRDAATDPLTAADWVGPDGIIYPDWTWAGIHLGQSAMEQRGIPNRTTIAASISAKLAGPAQGEAFTTALERTIAQVGAAGGGVIQLPAGTFDLVRPLVIPYHRIVLRGAGRGQAVQPGGRADGAETRIRFTFGFGVLGEPASKILAFPESGLLTKQTVLSCYAQAFSPQATYAATQASGQATHIVAVYLTITPAGKPPVTVAISRDSADRKTYPRFQALEGGGPAMAVAYAMDQVPELQGVASATVQVTVLRRWKEGTTAKEAREVGIPTTFKVDWNQVLPDPRPLVGGTRTPVTSPLLFTGAMATDKRAELGEAWLLEPAARGDFALVVDVPSVESAAKRGLVPGAPVRININYSRTWDELIERDMGRTHGLDRDQHGTIARVEAASGKVRVVLAQALRFSLPVNEGRVFRFNPTTRLNEEDGTKSTRIQALAPIRECGLEQLVLEQTQPIWFDGPHFANAMNCWVRGVRVERAGRNPVVLQGLFNEIRDSEFIDPRWADNTGQGSAYVSGSSFGLIDGIYARNCRHAPNFSGSTGGVVRNSRFDSSDLQWHMAWGREHLVEGCTVDAMEGTGSYGWAAFAQRNIAASHGPGMGPRNVMYGCDLSGPKGGIFLGGKTEGFLILHNRIRAEEGPGIAIRYHVFNGLILGNSLLVQDRLAPGILFGDPELSQSRRAKTTANPNPALHRGLGAVNSGNDAIANVVYGGNGEFADGRQDSDRARSTWRVAAGNRVEAWQTDAPRPQPAMASVYATQLAHPQGFAKALAADRLYQPASAGRHEAPSRDDGSVVAQIAFRPSGENAVTDAAQWQGGVPYQGWLVDQGESFAARQGFRFGWSGGQPTLRLLPPGFKLPEDVRQRSWAAWVADDEVLPAAQWSKQRELSWQMELEPGRYRVFLACGAPNLPKRFERGQAQPFLTRHDWSLNGQILRDPGQSDVRRDAFWATVTVGEDRRLALRPAPTAITPRLSFIQIYRQGDPNPKP